MSSFYKKCLICNSGKKNDVLYWHEDEVNHSLWCWCNKCNRGYSIKQYCDTAGIDINEFLTEDFEITESKPNEVNALQWSKNFIPITDPRSEKGQQYIKSRGLNLDADFYYDLDSEGIVFPYYFDKQFCGAQIRFLEPRIRDDEEWKITTLPGTRLGLLFYGWNQSKIAPNVKGIILVEGAFNAISINQSLNLAYKGIHNNPWLAIACSGAGSTQHHRDCMKDLIQRGYKVVCALDADKAGISGLIKFSDDKAITHIATTGDPSIDWNDLLKEKGHIEFAKYFINNITSV